MIGRLLAPLVLLGVAAAQPPVLPPDILARLPAGEIHPYFVAFLVSRDETQPMSRELFFRHMDYNRSQFEAGNYRLVGPMIDGGRIRGIVILSAPSSEAALAMVEPDPAVREDVLTVEMHRAVLPNLDSVRDSLRDRMRGADPGASATPQP